MFEWRAKQRFARAAAVVTGSSQMAAQPAACVNSRVCVPEFAGYDPAPMGAPRSCCRGQREAAREQLANAARPARRAIKACLRRDQQHVDASRALFVRSALSKAARSRELNAFSCAPRREPAIHSRAAADKRGGGLPYTISKRSSSTGVGVAFNALSVAGSGKAPLQG